MTACERSPVVSRIQLDGLPSNDTQRLLESIAGENVVLTLASDVFDRTAGNPFFTAEIARGITVRDHESFDLSSIPLPALLQDAISSRLETLSPDTYRVLAIAAILGGEFSLVHLRLMMEVFDEEQLLTSLEEGVVARIVSESSSGIGEFRFTHALIHEVFSSQTSTTRSTRLHASLAEKLEDFYDGQASSHAAELEYHYKQGRLSLDPDGVQKELYYGLIAGQNALTGFEYEQAVEYFRSGLDLATEAGIESLKGGFYLGMAEASNPFGNPSVVVEYLNLAFTSFMTSGDTAGAIKAATVGVFRVARQAPEQVEMCRQGLAIVETGSVEAVRVMNEYGVAIGVGRMEYQEGISVLEEALEIARSKEEASLELHILHNLGFVHGVAGQHAKAVSRALELLERSKLLDAASVRANGHRTAAYGFAALGELDEAQKHIGESLRLSLRFQVFGGRLAEFDYRIASLISLNLGQWERALELNAQIESRANVKDGFGLRESVEVMIGDERAALTTASQRLASASDDGLFNTSTSAESALLIAELGRRLGDEDAVRQAKDVAFSILNNQQHAGYAVETANFTLAVVAGVMGDSVEASERYADLRDQSGLLPLWTLGSCPDRVLALLSLTMDNVDQAIVHFEDALVVCEKAGYGPELAWSCSEYAEMLLQRGGRVERDRIINLINRGLKSATRFGMRPLIQRLSVARKVAESIPAHPEPVPGGLMLREIEVLRLVALGRSNPDIAAELVITLNTVMTHVRHIFEKTESVSRGEASAFAYRHGLMEERSLSSKITEFSDALCSRIAQISTCDLNNDFRRER